MEQAFQDYLNEIVGHVGGKPIKRGDDMPPAKVEYVKGIFAAGCNHERKLWLQPTPAMLTAGIAELQSLLGGLADSQFENDNSDVAEHIDVQTVTDAEVGCLVLQTLLAMWKKHD